MIVATSTTLFADDTQKVVEAFLQNALAQNPQYDLKKVEIEGFKNVDGLPGWRANFIKITLANTQNGEEVQIPDTIFTNGVYVSPDFINTKTQQKLKEVITPSLSKEFYTKANLIYGDLNAPNTMIIFSDPLCPFCMDFVPSVIDEIKASKTKKIALFYYNLPLTRIHPQAPTVIKAALAAEMKGAKEVHQGMYDVEIEKGDDDAKIVEKVAKYFKVKLDVKDLENKKLQDIIDHDLQMSQKAMVRGTPTVFFNGEKDQTRSKYKAFLK